MTTQEKVQQALTLYFGDARLKLETGPSGKVYGSVVSGTFGGQDDATRQHRVWQALRQKLSDAELQPVVLLVTLTPEEAQSVADDAA